MPIASESNVTPPATIAEFSSAAAEELGLEGLPEVVERRMIRNVLERVENRSLSGVNAHRSAQKNGNSA